MSEGMNECQDSAKHTKIVEILELDGKKAQVALEESPFHPSGGGQPGDTGELRAAGFRAAVRDTKKSDKSKKNAVLDLLLLEGTPCAGMEVEAEIDKARHAMLSRMHTGQHVFSRLQENAYENLETLKVNIGVDESVAYVHYDGVLTWDSLFAVEEKTVEVIKADLPVESFLTSKDEAKNIPELKAKWERIHDEAIRVVRVAGIDATACAGTHVARTGEIGDFLITGFNGSAPNWEVRFTVREERTREYSRVMRRLLREAGCKLSQLEDIFVRQKADNAVLRQIMDKVRGYVSIPWEVREAGGHPLYLAVLPGLTKELLSAPARDCVVEHPDAFCLVLLPDTVADAPFPFILLRGAQVPVNLSGLTGKFPELNARGGGKADWVNGTTTQKSVSVWRHCVASLLTSF